MGRERPLLILTFAVAAFAATLGQEFSFNEEIVHNDTCGLHPHSDWASTGTIVLKAGDSDVYEPMVSIYAAKELCRVDLTACPPDHPPSTQQACFCKSKTKDTYHIQFGSTTGPCQAGMELQARIQGRGAFRNISGVSHIGMLPDKNATMSSVKATYTIDGGPPTELSDTQIVKTCPNKRFHLEVCVDTNEPSAELGIYVDEQRTTAAGGRCVSVNHHFSSGQTRRITFQYKVPMGCTILKYMDFKEDSEICTPSTTVSTKTSQQIVGVCPNTPRHLTTLPWGTKVVVDDVSFNKTWTIFQRRVSGAIYFYRPWKAYVEGFGNLTDSFWLGLQEIHSICNELHKCELLIDLQYLGKPSSDTINQTKDGCYFAHYDEFWVGPASGDFKMSLSGYSGTAGNGLLNDDDKFTHDKQRFTTFDEDNDNWSSNCAVDFTSAWWFSACLGSHLNGRWGAGESKGLRWSPLTYKNSATFSEMKVRRKQ